MIDWGLPTTCEPQSENNQHYSKEGPLLSCCSVWAGPNISGRIFGIVPYTRTAPLSFAVLNVTSLTFSPVNLSFA